MPEKAAIGCFRVVHGGTHEVSLFQILRVLPAAAFGFVFFVLCILPRHPKDGRRWRFPDFEAASWSSQEPGKRCFGEWVEYAVSKKTSYVPIFRHKSKFCA
ncbi:MAG: hypothetical protein QM270_11675 [Bacillota bacterium]|nr:hypothetical protein [Bacillota bacterium]